MNLLKTLAAISSMTMISRVTGLLRESLMTTFLGRSIYTDAFLVAFRLPNLLRRLFAEGAFSQAFVPLLGEYKVKHGEAETRTLVDHTTTFLVWSTLLISVIGIVSAPFLIIWIMDTKDQTAESYKAAVLMTQMMFPYIVCMSFVALAGGILNTWRQFKIPAFTPVLLNLSFIAATLFLTQWLATPVYALAIGVMVGGLLQVAIQIPSLVKIGMLPRIGLNPLRPLRDPGVRRILSKMGPALIGVGAAQISLLINTSIAGGLGAGSVTALTLADRLMEFPTAMLGVALGTILLPGLAKANTEEDTVEYSALLDWGLRLTFLLALPAAVGLAVLAEPVMATLFNYGKFTRADTIASSLPLMAYSAGLIGIIVVKILTPAFFARQDFRTPVRIAIGVVIAVQLMNFPMVHYLGLSGLALSISMGACINAGVMYFLLRKRAIFLPKAGWLPFFVKLVMAVATMGAVAWFGRDLFVWSGGPEISALMRGAALMAIVGVCAIVYFAVLFVLGFRIRDFKRSAR